MARCFARYLSGTDAGTEVPPPGLMPAAVRTLHHAHRTLVSQLLGAPLRPGALRDLYEAREAEELAKQQAGPSRH